MRPPPPLLSAATVVALAGSLLVVTATPAVADPSTVVKAAPPPADPIEAAKRSAKERNARVEIESLRTEQSTTWANPDGSTLHAELTTTPVRVRRGATWVPVDPTLVEEGGVIRPRATRIGLELPAGSTQSVIKVRDGKNRAAIRWPGTLPKPRLAGNTATYTDALGKGVDLVFSASATGFDQRVVIRERPAADLTVRMPVTLPAGLRYDKGALVAKGRGRAATIATVGDAVLTDAKAKPDDPAAGRRGLARVSFGADAQGPVLSLTPDRSYLAGKDVSYPVSMAIASDWVGAGLDADTFVSSAQYPNSQATGTWLRAGKSSNGAETWRTYLRFVVNGTNLSGSRILNADLRMWNYRSNDCGNQVGSGIVARRVTSSWSPSALRWIAQPPATATNQAPNQAAYSDTCSWGIGELYYSVEGIVQEWASGTPDYGFQLRAVNESDATNWRQYRSSEFTGSGGIGPVLFIDYEPATTEEILSITDQKAPNTITYDEAVALRAGTPEQESEAPTVTLQQAQAMAIGANSAFAPDEETSWPEADEDWSEVLPECGAGAADCFPAPEGDTAAPAVISTAPGDAATDVARDTEVTATFDEPVTVAALTLRDPAGGVVAGATSTDAGGTVVRLTPAAALAPATVYTAVVTGATDAAGNVQTTAHTWSFTTGVTEPAPEPEERTLTLGATTDGWIDDWGGGDFADDLLWAGTYGDEWFQIHERSYLTFPVAPLAGKTITSATLSLKGVDAYGCGTAGIRAERITGSWNASSLTWDNQPAASNDGAAVSADPGGCAGEPDPEAAWTWQLAGMVQAWANGATNRGLRLRGADEAAPNPYDRGWQASEYLGGGGEPPTLTVTYVDAAPAQRGLVASATAAPQRKRAFYKHTTFEECDKSDNDLRVWSTAVPEGYVKNSFGWCQKFTHLLTVWERYFSIVPPGWKTRKVDEGQWIFTNLINTYVGPGVGKIDKLNPPAGTYASREVVAKSRITAVWPFKSAERNAEITLQPKWNVKGCAITSTQQPPRTINQWRPESDPIVEFTFHSDEAAAPGYDRAATCTPKPYVEIINFKAAPLRLGGASKGKLPVFRCDTSPDLTMYYGGCILVATTPRMVVSTAARIGTTAARTSVNKAQEFAEHLYTVFNAPDQTKPTKPGGGKKFPGDGDPNSFASPMTRAMDPQVEADNRRTMGAACTESWTDAERAGKECDEYPFAKTHEGAASPDWDFSVKPITKSSNTAGGARENILFMRYRVLEGDPFKVMVTTSSVIPDTYWSGVNPED